MDADEVSLTQQLEHLIEEGVQADGTGAARQGDAPQECVRGEVDNKPLRFPRGKPQLLDGERCTVYPDEQCLWHCLAAALNVQHYKELSEKQRTTAA